MQRGLRVITLQEAIGKSPILLSQYWKNEWLDGTIIISYFDGSNNFFADCTLTLLRFYTFKSKGTRLTRKKLIKVIKKVRKKNIRSLQNSSMYFPTGIQSLI